MPTCEIENCILPKPDRRALAEDFWYHITLTHLINLKEIILILV